MGAVGEALVDRAAVSFGESTLARCALGRREGVLEDVIRHARSRFRPTGRPVEADQIGGAVEGAEPEPPGNVLDVPGLGVEAHRRVHGQ